jgi:hypothetical protein
MRGAFILAVPRQEPQPRPATSENGRYVIYARRHELALSGTARAGSAGGLLIHAAVGSSGGTGTPRGKRSG